jgi:hypothetical protein
VELIGRAETDWVLLPDWRLLQRLNELVGGPGVRGKDSMEPEDPGVVQLALERARRWVEARLGALDINYRVPAVEVWTVLWPRDDGELPPVE